ncbi:MAG: peroxidase-related enzyme [Bacteroidetes bacterium]|jgi:uncharacterized peroxidase-related enzyme|nr:peroxidase-related enzyme [Bacteroidota bacterium]
MEPYIKTIPHDKAGPELKAAYDDILKSRGKLAEVHKIQSLNPDALLAHMDLYMSVMFGKSPLKRYQREMMAVVVSSANGCAYCINHHEQALLSYWKDEDRTAYLQTDRSKADLSAVDAQLCDLAEVLTKEPSADFSGRVRKLKDTGLDDRAVLDAVQVIAYFNFVNRLVLGLGVDFNEQEMKGYKY